MKILLILALLAGGGVSIGAEQAVPGDFLYPVKVNVNEKIASSFSIGAQAYADREVTLVEKRIEEAYQIAIFDASAETEAEARGRLEAQISKAEDKISKLEAEGDVKAAAEVSSRLEAVLRASSEALSDLRIQNLINSGVEIESAVNAALESAVQSRTRIENQARASIETEQSVEGFQTAVGNKITEVENFIVRMENKVSAEAQSEAEASLSAGKELKAQAEAELQAGNFSEAFSLFLKAFRAIQETKTNLVINGIATAVISVGNNGSESEEAEEKAGDMEEQSDEGDENGDELEIELGLEAETEAEVESEGGTLDTESKVQVDSLLNI